jgi:hypothetical protein
MGEGKERRIVSECYRTVKRNPAMASAEGRYYFPEKSQDMALHQVIEEIPNAEPCFKVTVVISGATMLTTCEGNFE